TILPNAKGSPWQNKAEQSLTTYSGGRVLLMHRMRRSLLLLYRLHTWRPLRPQWSVPLVSPAELPRTSGILSPRRTYSSDSGLERRKVLVVGLPNPVIWFRSRIYFFLIRAYFDQDFNIDQFTDGAKQAFTLVSRLLSQCKFDELKNLVCSEVVSPGYM
ncbi:hypothetical protein GDO86_017058, partial [Hymenochirus boettgeri]